MSVPMGNPYARPQSRISFQDMMLLQMLMQQQQQPGGPNAEIQKKGAEGLKKLAGLGATGGAGYGGYSILGGSGGGAALGGGSGGALAANIAAPSQMLPALNPMLASGYSELAAPQIAGASHLATGGGAAAGAGANASSYAALTGGPASLAYWAGPAAFLAGGAALAPSIAKGGEKFSKMAGITDDHMNRSYKRDEALQSKIIPRQLDGYGDLNDDQRGQLLDKLGALGAITMPGNVNKETGETERGLGREYIVPKMSFDDKHRLTEKYGPWWGRKLGLSQMANEANLTTDWKKKYTDIEDSSRSMAEQNKFNSMLQNAYGGAMPSGKDIDPGFNMKPPEPMQRGPSGAMLGMQSFMKPPLPSAPARSRTSSPGIDKNGNRIRY